MIQIFFQTINNKWRANLNIGTISWFNSRSVLTRKERSIQNCLALCVKVRFCLSCNYKVFWALHVQSLDQIHISNKLTLVLFLEILDWTSFVASWLVLGKMSCWNKEVKSKKKNRTDKKHRNHKAINHKTTIGTKQPPKTAMAIIF